MDCRFELAEKLNQKLWLLELVEHVELVELEELVELVDLVDLVDLVIYFRQESISSFT